MKKKIIISIITALFVFLCFGMIYYFSSQNNNQTNDLSKKFTKQIAEIIFQNFSAMEKGVQNTIINELNLFIRKAAHFSLYFFMSIFVYIGTTIWIKKYLLSGIISVLICMSYAAIDELHQSFVPGRTPLVKDIFIDSSGALLGTVICFLMISAVYFIRHISAKNQHEK